MRRECPLNAPRAMSARALDLALLILACAAAAQMHPSAPRVQFGTRPPVDNRMTHDKLRHAGATQNEPLDQARDALGTLVKASEACGRDPVQMA